MQDKARAISLKVMGTRKAWTRWSPRDRAFHSVISPGFGIYSQRSRKAVLQEAFVAVVSWDHFLAQIFPTYLSPCLGSFSSTLSAYLIQVASSKNGSCRLPGGEDVGCSKLWYCWSLSPSWCFKEEKAMRKSYPANKKCPSCRTLDFWNLWCHLYRGSLFCFVCATEIQPEESFLTLHLPGQGEALWSTLLWLPAYVGSKRASPGLRGLEKKGQSFLKIVWEMINLFPLILPTLWEHIK